MKKHLLSAIFALLVFFAAAVSASAASYNPILARWSKEQKFQTIEGANLTIRATYYSAEFTEALVQSEADKNMWTKQEAEDYKYNFLKALQLDQYIPIQIKFVNNGPTMHAGPFDIMVKLRLGNKLYKPADYDKRFNFGFVGEKEGLVYFPRYDEKTGKDLLKGVKTAKLEFNSGVSTTLEGKTVTFLWDIANDDPSKLYSGKAADRFETDRLIKRLDKLRKDKAGLEAQMKTVNDEIGTIQSRLDELSKK